jgi:hypothetical protein
MVCVQSELVQDLLETTGDITRFYGSPNSAADCLLTWLDQLPQPVVPPALHEDAFDAVQAGGLAGALSIVNQLPKQQKAAMYQVCASHFAATCSNFSRVRNLSKRSPVCVRTAGTAAMQHVCAAWYRSCAAVASTAPEACTCGCFREAWCGRVRDCNE